MPEQIEPGDGNNTLPSARPYVDLRPLAVELGLVARE
jgi:hypothetical protein